MIMKEIAFRDFDDNPVTEIHYFHISKAELIQMELSTEGGMIEKLQGVVKSGDGSLIIETFNDIIGKAYGQRDPAQPTKFFKSEKITNEFMNSLAFDALFQELMTSPTAAADLVNGLFPKDLVAQANAMVKSGDQSITTIGTSFTSFEEDEKSGLKDPRDENGNLVPWAFRKPTDKEIREMSRPQLMDVSLRQSAGWTPPDPGL